MKVSLSSLKQILLTTLCALTVSALQADVLAEYNFDGSSLASADASTSWDSSDISNGTGVPMTVLAAAGNPFPAIDITFGDFDYATLAASITANGYYSFTITPDSGTQLTFTDLSFDMFKQSGATATVSATLFSSVDGFATVGDSIGAGTLVGGAGESGVILNRSITLGSLPIVTTATEFRLYLDDGGANNSANQFLLDNIKLNGSVAAIPEPSTALLMVAGLFASLLFSRRRSSK